MTVAEEAAEGARLGIALLMTRSDVEAHQLVTDATRTELQVAAVMLALACQTITALAGGDVREAATLFARRHAETQ